MKYDTPDSTETVRRGLSLTQRWCHVLRLFCCVVCCALSQSQALSQPMILNPDEVADYVQNFNAMEDEPVVAPSVQQEPSDPVPELPLVVVVAGE